MNSRDKNELRYTNARKVSERQSLGFESSSIALPEGSSLFIIKKEGVYRVDVLPYKVGKGNPEADPGMIHYERTFYVHRGIGPDGKGSYCCLWKTFQKKCPICDYVLKNQGKVDKETLRKLNPSRRQLFVVIDHANRDKGIQIWDISYHLFGKLLASRISKSDKEDDYENFFHLEDGKTLKIEAEEKKMEANTFYNVNAIEFKERKEPLKGSILKQVPCLDDLLKEVDYKKLEAIFLQQPQDDDDDSDSKDDDSDDVDDTDDDDETPKSKKVKEKKKSKKDDDDDSDSEADDSDDGEFDSESGDAESDDEDGDSEADDEDNEDEESDDEDDDQDDDEEGSEVDVGSKVLHKKHGVCTIIKINKDDTVNLEDEDGAVYKKVPPEDVEPYEDEDEEDAPKKKKVKK